MKLYLREKKSLIIELKQNYWQFWKKWSTKILFRNWIWLVFQSLHPLKCHFYDCYFKRRKQSENYWVNLFCLSTWMIRNRIFYTFRKSRIVSHARKITRFCWVSPSYGRDFARWILMEKSNLWYFRKVCPKTQMNLWNRPLLIIPAIENLMMGSKPTVK